MPDVVYGPIERDGAIAWYCDYCGDTEVTVNGNIYKFINRAGVTLAWIPLADCAAIQLVKRKCCGGTKERSMFHFANSAQIQYWEERG